MRFGKKSTQIAVIALLAAIAISFLLAGAYVVAPDAAPFTLFRSFQGEKTTIICKDDSELIAENMELIEKVFSGMKTEYKDVAFEDYAELLIDKNCDVVLDISPVGQNGEIIQSRAEIMLFSEEVTEGLYFAYRKDNFSLKQRVDEAIEKVE